MIHTDGRRTVANAPAKQHKPAHGGYPGQITPDGHCPHTGLRKPECSCIPCLEELYRRGAA